MSASAMSIRLRVAAVFALALAAAFALGSWLLVSQVSSVVLKAVDTQLAGQLSRAVQQRAQAAPLKGFGDSESVAQYIDSSGRVTAASPDAGRQPLLDRAEQRAARHRPVTLTTIFDEGPERLMATKLPGRPGWIAVAGISLESANGTISAVVTRLVIGGSAFVLVAAAGAYFLARAALAPVERLRREAAALSAADPAGRLPVPRSRDEIAALAGTMNNLLARLHSALARQRSFVADASHELRTPFAVLQGELELAAKPGRSREDLADAVAAAADEAARLSRITDDLLLLARSDEDQLTTRTEPTDLAALLSRSAQQAAQRCAKAGVTCSLKAPPELIAQVDPGRIRQAVDNLVDNSLRFAPTGTQVDISAEANGNDVEITVTDAGPGFPADYLPHAFERFRRPDGGRARADGGAGLGLAIVLAIARAHGGTVTASNRPDGGAIVRLTLPDAISAS
ncbi:MAG: sensor histidine kinase [Streptosporangiaceae bacterium]